MLDFRLRVFHVVAHLLSFTKAAEELSISQPAVTKNIKELESQLGIRLFDRKAGKVALTSAGRTVLNTAERIQALYRQLEFDLNILKNQFGGILKLGASTTAGQYVLPEILARFHRSFPEVKLAMHSANTETIEQAILQHEIMMGVVEGKKHQPLLSYTPFIQDEIVAITHKDSKYGGYNQVSLEELIAMPVVCREKGSGSLEVLEAALQERNLSLSDLQVEMMLGSTEAIKSFLENYDCIGFVSIAAVAGPVSRGEFKIIEIPEMEILREFYFVHPLGVASGLAASFMDFARHAYNHRL
ncbi:LysR family transcriptional regulator [Arachidicoccus terrestris]|uniref:LysR family transcriptional regulator n=1 Tax=Arachidicoccus terrestris TaxID=2875539 RepID=UPI001CC4A25E|nr:LysR family transcriptional regulator [Arachidicoccus terrestris]UAY54372.1 LysR family transcriptional regulator [Arachidicoccus terrestris]